MTPGKGLAALLVGVCLPTAGFLAACSSDGSTSPASAPAAPASSAPTGTVSSSPAATSPAASASPTAKQSTITPSAPPTTPTPGSITEIVPARTQATAKPVKLRKTTARFDKSLNVTITDVHGAEVKAKKPGETSGASVIFTVVVKNGSDRVVDLNSLVVNVLDDKQVPGSRISSAPASPMPLAVAGGRSAEGRFVYVVPTNARRPITVQVSLSADQPVLLFRGSV